MRVCMAEDGSELYEREQELASLAGLRCARCGIPLDAEGVSQPGDGYGVLCYLCEPLYPSSLLKASADPFDYALRLMTGELIHFEACVFRGEWVHLIVRDLHPLASADTMRTPNPPFDRGVDVRLSSIVWCADAPFGS